MTPDPAVPPLPTSGRVAALDSVIAGGTVPGVVVLALGYYLTDTLSQLRDEIGAQLDRLGSQVDALGREVTDVRIQTAQLPALEARVRALEEERRNASPPAARR